MKLLSHFADSPRISLIFRNLQFILTRVIYELYGKVAFIIMRGRMHVYCVYMKFTKSWMFISGY